MSQQSNHTSILLSLETARAEFQAVATRDYLVLDVQARNYGVDGRQRTEYALAHLSRKDAVRLRNLLNEAIAASGDIPDPRQTGLWSNTTTAAVAEELRRGALV